MQPAKFDMVVKEEHTFVEHISIACLKKYTVHGALCEPNLNLD